MSEENVEIVRAFIDAWNRGDQDAALAALAHLAPEFELDFSRRQAPSTESFGAISCPRCGTSGRGSGSQPGRRRTSSSTLSSGSWCAPRRTPRDATG
jgi:hypothetical protein